jgi:hypothetical protein
MQLLWLASSALTSLIFRIYSSFKIQSLIGMSRRILLSYHLFEDNVLSKYV